MNKIFSGDDNDSGNSSGHSDDGNTCFLIISTVWCSILHTTRRTSIPSHPTVRHPPLFKTSCKSKDHSIFHSVVCADIDDDIDESHDDDVADHDGACSDNTCDDDTAVDNTANGDNYDSSIKYGC